MKNVEVNSFKEWLGGIPMKEYEIVRCRIIKECRITPQIFRHWKCGTTRIPVLAREKINEIAGFELFMIE